MGEMRNRFSFDQVDDNSPTKDSGEDEEELGKSLKFKKCLYRVFNYATEVCGRSVCSASACLPDGSRNEKQLEKSVRCDVCSKTLTNPRITRACSHIMCFRCLGTKRQVQTWVQSKMEQS